MKPHELTEFADRYLHAQEAAIQSHFERGTSGLEVEWNVVDSSFRPLHHVGSGPDAVSFVEVLREKFIPPSLLARNELEVFHWLSEWTTRPYYQPAGAVFESRILEGVMLNALRTAGLSFGERLYAWPGNLLCPVAVDDESVPRAWELTKRRYLQRCVELFGEALATAGVHTNVSLPEPLLSLDFLHRPPSERGNSLVAYRNEHYIRGARVLRAFAPAIIATSACSPMRAESADGKPLIRLTEHDSNRLLRFPNPADLDVPHLYRSHADYVSISGDLVRRRIRFGNNNWTPTRARSDREYVDRIIHITSDQLHDVYRKGVYRAGDRETVEQLLQRIEIENLLARIDIPMARVEIRVDEGGHELAVDLANLVFRELLLIRTYADPQFGAAFAYNADDIARARRNESATAQHGLRATIENPFTGQACTVREFLRWSLDQVRELAAAMGTSDTLLALTEMAEGAPNAAERLRERLVREVGPGGVVPIDHLQQLATERAEQVSNDVEYILDHVSELGDEAPKLRELIERAREAVQANPAAPVRFEPPVRIPASVGLRDKTAEVVELAQHLIRIPSVTNCPAERLSDVIRAARFIAGYLRDAGLDVHLYDEAKYPSLLAWFPGRLQAPVMLSGHFDVVAPFPDDGQFNPVIEGDYLWGRGSADMKTVVATYMVWMRDLARRGEHAPPVNLMLVGNEENGETEPTGTPHILAQLQQEHDYAPELMIVGERTGEKGDEAAGEICPENRGVMRLALVGRGVQSHTGVGRPKDDLVDSLARAREMITRILREKLTLAASDGWQTDYHYSFIHVGQVGVYNVVASEGQLGLEVRPIPQDDAREVVADIRKVASDLGLDVQVQCCEPGIACDRDNPYLHKLIEAARDTFGIQPVIGRKKPGTSGRFAPRGQAVIWGQSGIGPHSPSERHFIPSIKGYYDALTRFAELLV